MKTRTLFLILVLAAGGASTAQSTADPSVEADLRTLQKVAGEALRELVERPESTALRITFVGKGATTKKPQAEPTPEPPDERRATPLRAFRAFNPVTGNEFRVELSAGAQTKIVAAAERLKLGVGNPGPAGSPESPERIERTRPAEAPKGQRGFTTAALRDWPLQPARPMLASWSNNSDDRNRLSVVGTPTTTWPWRTIADMGGCTGTLIGPRHLVTAGHCIWNRTNKVWYSGFVVTPGLAGNQFAYGQVTFPSAGFNWYFTPEQYREDNPAGGVGQYDFGILVLPQSLGNATGWMGWWHGTNSFLQSTNIFNRGFPTCNGSANGTPRTDDPGDPGSNVVCIENHLYGDPKTCSLGNFTKIDPSGWARRVAHSCDASAAQSGSPLYLYVDGVPAVTAVHTNSSCGKTAADPACTAADARPLTATRITREYSSWISYFRTWKP